MNQDEEAPKLHIDSDWKAEAQAEKERLAKQEQEKAKTGGPGRERPPQADFKSLMGVLASQTILSLGAMGDPKTGKVVIDLEGARFCIGLLGVLEDKTKGNLTEEEAKELGLILTELRNRFVQITHMVAQQAPPPGPGPAPDTPGSESAPSTAKEG
jgi:hypothetical protein